MMAHNLPTVPIPTLPAGSGSHSECRHVKRAVFAPVAGSVQQA
jgi:hypothetical protein